MIRLFITGGTIDAKKIERGDKYIFGKTCIPQMLEQGGCKIDIKSQVLFLKDFICAANKDQKNFAKVQRLS